MPSYAKFLKDILSNKRKLEEHETVALTEQCSAAIQNKLPARLKDPSGFPIPCLIGNVPINCALCDLGSSVSLMALSLCKKIGIRRDDTNYYLLTIGGLLYEIPYRCFRGCSNKSRGFICAGKLCDFTNGGEHARPYHYWEVILGHYGVPY